MLFEPLIYLIFDIVPNAMKSYWAQIIEIDQGVPRDELRKLLTPSNLRGWVALATTYAIIALSFFIVWRWPSPLTILVSLILLGGRQLALAILTHEAVHRSLFASRTINEWVGRWLCAYPMGINIEGYRAEHLEHHKKTGSTEDPDRGLITPYPVSPRSMLRKCGRDLFGITALKRVYFISLMGMGFLTYTLSTNTKKINQRGRSIVDIGRTAIRNLYGTVVTNILLFALLFALNAPLLYLLWVGAYFSTFSLFLRIRSIAEHAGTPDPARALLNTRTTHASWIARLTVAPHRVNYHLEHHLFMQVPYFQLPALHRLLQRVGTTSNSCVAKNYVEVLRIASTARKQEPNE